MGAIEDVHRKIDNLATEHSETRERLSRTEAVTDRLLLLEAKVEDLRDAVNKLFVKQAVLVLKVSVIVGALVFGLTELVKRL